MNGQIVHDSLHSRAGWTQSYLLKAGATIVGYGAIAVGGPWRNTRTVFEFYVSPEYRSRIFDLFETLVAGAGITAFEVQTNDILLTIVLHAWCHNASSDKIIFHDKLTTTLPSNGAVLRRAIPEDVAQIFSHRDQPVGDWLLEVNGGILFHYNKPYGDIYLEVAALFRRHGLGSYLLQELKRICYEGGSVPCVRCRATNLPSIKTIQKAGFAPCAHVLVGPLSPPPALMEESIPE
jgi:GNAT superfamily N-acetyltransferase